MAQQGNSGGSLHGAGDQEELQEPEPTLFLQPETRRITQEQLINEVKGIYAGLVMVERKCVEITQARANSARKLSNEQWQALIALHRTLLQEHHDFFLASQHPTASPALRRLAEKYAMPARMWRHGIHSFLELLRQQLPDSLEHMLAFVYIAYSMMALLKESVPSFLETWTECLGDLSLYRMAIERAHMRDRELWSDVARKWYNRAADQRPFTGRIQHHLVALSGLSRLHGPGAHLPTPEYARWLHEMDDARDHCYDPGRNQSDTLWKSQKRFEALLRNDIPNDPNWKSPPDKLSRVEANATGIGLGNVLDKLSRTINAARPLLTLFTIFRHIAIINAMPTEQSLGVMQDTAPDHHLNVLDAYLSWLAENCLKLVAYPGAMLLARRFARDSEHSKTIKLSFSLSSSTFALFQQNHNEPPWLEIILALASALDYGRDTFSDYGGGKADNEAGITAWTPDYRTNFPLSVLVVLMIIPRLCGLGAWLRGRMLAGRRQLAMLVQEEV